MSWSARYNIKGQVGYDLVESNVNEVPEHYIQAGYAKLAVMNLINTGALGDRNGHYAVTLSGHGNPNNKPVPGYANDFVSISVSQMSVPSASAAE